MLFFMSSNKTFDEGTILYFKIVCYPIGNIFGPCSREFVAQWWQHSTGVSWFYWLIGGGGGRGGEEEGKPERKHGSARVVIRALLFGWCTLMTDGCVQTAARNSLILLLQVRTTDERVQTDWQWPLSRLHSIMMVNAAQPGEGGGGALPLSLYLPSRAKLLCTLQLRGLTQSSYFSSTLFSSPPLDPYHCALSNHPWTMRPERMVLAKWVTNGRSLVTTDAIRSVR
jgi:hypothetical protein